MSSPGDADNLLIRARSALLDALDALGVHRESIVVIGAQAIYLHTAGAVAGQPRTAISRSTHVPSRTTP